MEDYPGSSVPWRRQYLPRNIAYSVGRTLADEYFWKNHSVTGKMKD
jgi:hypothetical protein